MQVPLLQADGLTRHYAVSLGVLRKGVVQAARAFLVRFSGLHQKR